MVVSKDPNGKKLPSSLKSGKHIHTKEPMLLKTCVNWLINWDNKLIILNAFFVQTAAFMQIRSKCGKEPSYETFHTYLNFLKDLN